MRLQFGLRTLLLLFLVIGMCLFVVRDGCELREYNQVRKNMPSNGVSWKYEPFDEGLLFTLIANEEPIEGFEVEVQDDKDQVVFNSGYMSGDSRYALKFFLQKKNRDGSAAKSPADITVALPPTLHGSDYQFIVNHFAPLDYGYFLDGSSVLHMLDQNRREYLLSIRQRSKSEVVERKVPNP